MVDGGPRGPPHGTVRGVRGVAPLIARDQPAGPLAQAQRIGTTRDGASRDHRCPPAARTVHVDGPGMDGGVARGSGTPVPGAVRCPRNGRDRGDDRGLPADARTLVGGGGGSGPVPYPLGTPYPIAQWSIINRAAVHRWMSLSSYRPNGRTSR